MVLLQDNMLTPTQRLVSAVQCGGGRRLQSRLGGLDS
jgi:hypothetical protein